MVKQHLLQILVVVANIHVTALKAEVGKGPCELDLDMGWPVLENMFTLIMHALHQLLKAILVYRLSPWRQIAWSKGCSNG